MVKILSDSIFSNSIDKPQFKWLVKHFGYSFGIFGTIKWNQHDTARIIDEWAGRYHIRHLISGIIFLGSNIQIDSNDHIVSELILRTIIRPAWGSHPHIKGQPLPKEYEQIIDRYFSL